MTSLRELGENFALVLSLYDGKDFVPVLNNEEKFLKIVATLDSRETLETEPIAFKDENPEFNTELVWTMDRLTFQALRSRKALLKLQVSDESDKILGSFLFDLKEAIPQEKPAQSPDESYIVHANWRKLKALDLPCGKIAPSIRAALVIEPNNQEADEEEEEQTVMDEDLHSEIVEQPIKLHTGKDRLSPVLNNAKGYFAIGDESQASHIFLFNIFICFGRHVQLAFPKDTKVSGQESLHFVYDLFGTQITSKPFCWDAIDEFKPERATAKLFTTPEKLLKFFQEKLKTFCIFVCGGKIHFSLAEINLDKAMKLSLEDLKNGQLAVFEGILPLEPVKLTPDDASFIHKTNKSESMMDQAHIGVRFSVGLHPDAGLLLMSEKDQQDCGKVQQENIEASEKIWAPIPSKNSFEMDKDSTLNLSRPQQEGKDTYELIPMDTTDDNIQSDHEIVMEKLKKNLLDEPIIKYKFIANLRKIKLNQGSIQCVIKYKYKAFCSTEVSTAPSFNVVSDDKSHEVKRGYCEYNFSAKESAVKRPMEKHPLHIKVFDEDELVGVASINLSKLFSVEATRTLDSKSYLVQAPILKKNMLGSADLIGTIEALFVLKELASNEMTLPTSNKSAFDVVKKTSDDDEKAALELEEWKQKQKDRFKNQLQSLESHHINVLSQEWEKREKERENVIHEKLNEIIFIEKELKKSLEENKHKHSELLKFEEELKIKEKKLAEREEKLQNLLGSNAKRGSTDKLNERVKELVKENEKLKQENEQLKTKNESLRTLTNDMAPLKKEITNLRSQNLELHKMKTANLEQIGQLEKAKDFYKSNFEDVDQLVKKLQAEKEKGITEKMENIIAENAKLREVRDLYEQRMLAMASFEKPVLDNSERSISSSTTTQVTQIENKKAKSEIARLKKQRELFLNTKVYKETDEIIKMIDAKLHDLQQAK